MGWGGWNKGVQCTAGDSGVLGKEGSQVLGAAGVTGVPGESCLGGWGPTAPGTRQMGVLTSGLCQYEWVPRT